MTDIEDESVHGGACCDAGSRAKPVLLVYATRYGQARKVAHHLTEKLRAEGHELDEVDAAELPAGFDAGNYRAVLMVASVHIGKHEREMVRFVKENRPTLECVPTALVSISMAQAAAEAKDNPPAQREGAREHAEEMIGAFLEETGFSPTRILAAAGALDYLEYGIVVRFVMREIARKGGAPTDTSKNYEFTDFDALDRFARDFVAAHAPAAPPGAGGSARLAS